LNMLRPGGNCPHCSIGKLDEVDSSDTHCDLKCLHCEADFRVYPQNSTQTSTKPAEPPPQAPKCPKCGGSGIDRGLVMDHRGMHRYECYSCNHVWDGEAKQRVPEPPTTILGRPSNAAHRLPCAYCSELQEAYGQYQGNHGAYHIYTCTTCKRQFSTHQSAPGKVLPYAPGAIQGQHLQMLERNALPWRPSNRWEEHAEQAGRGGHIWWPKGLSMDKRREFIADAIGLLRPFGSPIDQREMFAVADSLFRMWLNWITTNA
jgi:hypothetical protein